MVLVLAVSVAGCASNETEETFTVGSAENDATEHLTVWAVVKPIKNPFGEMLDFYTFDVGPNGEPTETILGDYFGLPFTLDCSPGEWLMLDIEEPSTGDDLSRAWHKVENVCTGEEFTVHIHEDYSTSLTR